jgi:DNA-binding MarR family transcriptional regulator
MGTALRETYRSFARALTPRLQASGVTLAMWFALRELWKRDGLSQVELARAIDSQPSAVVGLVAALRRAGLVRVGRREDRRVIEVRLTARGRAARARLAPHGIRLNDKALAGFSAAEVKSLFAMLARLRANIEQTDNPSR